MLTALVQRRQFAVGHGGFHAGRIAVRKDDVGIPELILFEVRDGKSTTIFEKSYVYDCGSESPRAFDRSLRSYNVMTEERTDLLFVSHLDSDHVNKIDRLMGPTPPKIVVLPYLDSVDLTELLMREVDDGSVTASMREYVSDPAGYWRRRGAEIVIFVEPGTGDDQPPGGGTPDAPVDPEGPLPPASLASEGAQVRLTCTIRKPRAIPPKSFAQVDYNIPRDVDHELPAGGVLAGAGSYFRLEWQAKSQERWRRADWILLPYVHPVESETRTAFRKAITQELGLGNLDPGGFAGALLEKLRSDRKRLVALYRQHFETGQNAISMSLYSGPERRHAAEERSGWLVPAGPARSFGYQMVALPVAWLGTGDSKLRQIIRRKPWLDFFNPFSQEIRFLSLPHHGSANDFHDDILNFRGLSVAIATTIRDRDRVAGLEGTLSRVESAGKTYRVVEDRPETEFSVTCARQMGPV
jgi:hypothetical protein